MTRNNYYQLFTSLFFGAALIILASCEGPAGPAGIDGLPGKDGADGKDANETCKLCHNPTNVDAKKLEFEFSKHSYGEAAFEEGGNTGCTPCHTTAGFQYVCKNNVSAAYVLQSGSTTKYSNGYNAIPGATLGEMTCVTCHPNIHKTYNEADYFPLTNVAAVPMTMWAGNKTITLAQKGGESHLCVKCHQPRAINTNTTVGDGKPIDYDFIAATANHAALFWDSTASAAKKVALSYRTHVHYGTAGAIFAGVGGVQIPGSQTYANSTHSSTASCQDCHMAAVTNRAGGHTFMVRGTAGALSSSTTWNFSGCNVSGCHTSLSASTATFTSTRSEIKGLLEQLGAKLKNGVGGLELMHKNSDPETNPWAGVTAKNYDGYWDIYDPSTNPDGVIRNPAPSGSWTTDQKNANLALPRLNSITNAQMGAIVNFQLCLREYSLGVHNYKYVKALLTNSIEAIAAQGY